jgi:hypothetical protein
MYGGAVYKVVSTDSGEHFMEFEEMVTVIQPFKPQVVVGQVHALNDDLFMIRAGKYWREDKHYVLDVVSHNVVVGVLDTQFQLNEKFKVKLNIKDGYVQVDYTRGERTSRVEFQSVTLVSNDECYFKVGNYMQSNVARGEEPGAYSEVWLYSVAVTHGQ